MRRMVIAAAVVVSCALTVWAQAPAPEKKAYFLVQSDVSNAQQYAEYAKLTGSIVEKFDGRFLSRGGRSATLEGRQAPSRVVVIEFPSYERAQAFYNSPEYRKTKKVREGAATLQVVLAEGM